MIATTLPCCGVSCRYHPNPIAAIGRYYEPPNDCCAYDGPPTLIIGAVRRRRNPLWILECLLRFLERDIVLSDMIQVVGIPFEQLASE